MHQTSPSLEEIFFAALELKRPEERVAYLDRACGDPELRRCVERLLALEVESRSFLEAPAVAPTVTVQMSRPLSEAAGTRVGPYKLLQQIGEGGFGVVYMAEQDKPVHRRVALKIIKPGMDSKQVIARFEAERQALAMMDHPNIARVFDAGTTDSGRPYFVMELVKGAPITKYCDDNALTPRERLELFVPVCQAIQHAHQKGIIHRDIKPSNVLVTLYDGLPVPKVIDFGIAKATDHLLTERTMFTEYGAIIGTFEYMSPEQAGLSAIDIDTRSDIYSLGVVLYELLAGSTPLTKPKLTTAGYAEILRRIKEEEPPKPSTRLSESKDGLPTLSAQRKTEPSKLAKLLRGELDWIVMKALEKDRTRRYETANGLARDIQRFLAGDPVEACPPSASYKLRKFARKHRPALVTAASFAALLLLGTILSTWQAIRATEAEGVAVKQRNRAVIAEANSKIERDRALDAQAEATHQRDTAFAEKKRADEQAAIAQAVNDFLQNDLLAQANPENEPDRDLTLRTVLDRAAKRIEGKFDQQPLVEASIRVTIAATYFALSLFPSAETHFRRSVELRREVLGEDDPRTLSAMNSLALALRQLRKLPEAEALNRTVLERRKRVLGENDPATLSALQGLVWLMFLRGKYADAEPLARQVLEASRRELGDDHSTTLESLKLLATILQNLQQYDEAESLLSQAYKQCSRLRGSEHPTTLLYMHDLAYLLSLEGKLDEAESLAREGVDRTRRVLGDAHQRSRMMMLTLSNVLRRKGKNAEREALLVRVVEARRNPSGVDDQYTRNALASLAALYFNQGKFAAAQPLAQQALEVSRRNPGNERAETLASLSLLARVYQAQAAYKEAEPLLVELHETSRRIFPHDHPQVQTSTNLLITNLIQQEKYSEAEPFAREALEADRGSWGKEDARTVASLAQLARVYQAPGQYDRADPLLLEFLETARRVHPPDHVQVRNALSLRTWNLLMQRRYVEAEPLAREFFATLEKIKAAEVSRSRAQGLVGESLLGQGKYAEADPFLRPSLTFLEKNQPDSWLRFFVQSSLGESLRGQQRYAEAEPLLLHGYEGLKAREAQFTDADKFYVTDAGARIVQLYEAWGQPDTAAHWRAKLEAGAEMNMP